MNKYAIILAAGYGKRMKTNIPKSGIIFNGKPIINHIVSSCKLCNFDDIYVVVGFQKEYLMNIIQNDVKYVIQEKQEGTAKAVLCCEEVLKNKKGLVVILYGDTPLVDNELIDNLIYYHINNNNDFTLTTSVLDNPKHYGRVYIKDGNVKKIIEYKDCNDEQKKIKKINCGLYCINLEILFSGLKFIKNNNVSKEYYFTDLVEILENEFKIGCYDIEDNYKLTGINDIDSLKRLEEEVKKRSNS